MERGVGKWERENLGIFEPAINNLDHSHLSPCLVLHWTTWKEVEKKTNKQQKRTEVLQKMVEFSFLPNALSWE